VLLLQSVAVAECCCMTCAPIMDWSESRASAVVKNLRSGETACSSLSQLLEGLVKVRRFTRRGFTHSRTNISATLAVAPIHCRCTLRDCATICDCSRWTNPRDQRRSVRPQSSSAHANLTCSGQSEALALLACGLRYARRWPARAGVSLHRSARALAS
jgi:hypothetical protein